MSKQEDVIWAHCNNCFRETKHLVIASKRQEYTEEDDDGNFIFGEKLNFEMLECCGCEGITFRRRCDASYEPHVVIDYFPPAVSRRKPEWLRGLTHVPIKLMFLMNEVYAALHSNSRSLAMMGARAMLDMAFVDTVGDQGNFEQKLDSLVKQGFVSAKNRVMLAAALEAGHAAAHRGHSPSADEVNQVMDIVENLIQAVYVLNKTADELKKATPPRPQRKKTGKGPGKVRRPRG